MDLLLKEFESVKAENLELVGQKERFDNERAQIKGVYEKQIESFKMVYTFFKNF